MMQLVPRDICVQKPVIIDLKVNAAYDLVQNASIIYQGLSPCASLKVEDNSVLVAYSTKQEKSLVTYLSIR